MKDLINARLYLIYSSVMLIFGGIIASVMRAQLLKPGMTILDSVSYNQCVTMHAIIMMLYVLMPAFNGIALIALPKMLNIDQTAFNRVSRYSFYMYLLSSVVLLSTIFVEGGPPSTGWSLYPPLSIANPDAMGLDILVFALLIMVLANLLYYSNILITILNRRPANLELWGLPVFVWSMLVTSVLVFVSFPVLVVAMIMLFSDEHGYSKFFINGGDPVLYQHIFWFFGHPQVYILIIPGFGLISEIISVSSNRKLHAYNMFIYASISICALSFLLWAHHMLTSGLPIMGELFFMSTSMLISIPMGIKIYSWIATLWHGRIDMNPELLMVVFIIILFSIGGLSGICLASVPVDVSLHDTYFIVAHIHYTLVAGSLFMVFAGLYYYWKDIFLGVYNSKLAYAHIILSAILVNLVFWPLFIAGIHGMPRHVVDYNPIFTKYQFISSIGAAMFILSQFLLFTNIFLSIYKCLCRKKIKSCL